MQRQLITSALPYINGIKHLGNLVGSMLPADVYARYLRSRGSEVLFLCATDEHGTPAELAAHDAGLEVAEYCAQMFQVQKDLAERWGLSFDHFGRSSSLANREITQHFARQLKANGFLEERVTEQVFSIDDNRFLPDRYVAGTCPHCGYTRARGDQCENCTRVLDPTDLISPYSAISGSSNLEVRESRHIFLLQSQLTDQIRAWVNTKTEWPVLASSIALKWLDEGLDDRGITRDLKWGVPIPEEWPGFEEKVFYVWFDAPIEYLGAAREWAELDESRDWKSWWYEAEDVNYTEFMAKDNVPFHTVSFPATIIGSREPWKLVDQLKAFNWLTYYGGKFSTSQHRGVFMNDALDLLPADVWRYFLLANAPEASDADFTWERVADAVNKDLGGTLGNFVQRVLKFTESNFGNEVPQGSAWSEAEQELVVKLEESLVRLTENYDSLQFRKAAQETRAIWSLGNQYLDQVVPWKEIKVDKEAAAKSMRVCFGLIRLFAQISFPAMPSVATSVLQNLGESTDAAWPEAGSIDDTLKFPAGRKFAVPEVLFPKLADEQLAEWRQRFGGAD